MKKFLNFVKNNGLIIFAAFWFIDFVIGLITFKPSTLDATARKIKALDLGVDLIWTLVFTLEHTFCKTIKYMNEKIDLVNKRVDIIYDAIIKATKSVSEEKKEESADKDEKEVN